MSTVTTSDWFRERELVSARRESEFPNTKKKGFGKSRRLQRQEFLETRNICGTLNRIGSKSEKRLNP